MKDDKKAGTSWITTIIIGIIIYVLFGLWTGEREENEQAKKEFAYQTMIAETQWADSIAATQRIMNCITPDETAQYLGSFQCVVGFIGYSDNNTESKIVPEEPTMYSAFYSYKPEGFNIYSEDNLDRYVNRCVMVWGEISEHESLLIEKDITGVNIEILPDDACRR